MNSEELLEKVLNTTAIGAAGGGILKPEQANKFIDYMWDETALTSMVRRIKMNNPTMEIDKIAVGRRLARKATEGVDDGQNVDPTFAKISMTTVKIRLDWELTTESLEDNLEGDALEDHVARLMATQLGNDLEDLYINGDTASADPLMKSLDGFVKRFLAGAHVVSANGAGLNKSIFNKIVKTLPRKYLSRRGDLKFFTSPGLLQDFMNLTTDATGGAFLNMQERAYSERAVSGSGGGTIFLRPFGVDSVEIPLWPEDTEGAYSGATGDHGMGVWTFPKNMVIGVQREIKVYREYKPKKDTIEYTVYTRVANQIENLDAAVTVVDIGVDDADIVA
jgi:HK97 family phage major capsid protein